MCTAHTLLAFIEAHEAVVDVESNHSLGPKCFVQQSSTHCRVDTSAHHDLGDTAVWGRADCVWGEVERERGRK